MPSNYLHLRPGTPVYELHFPGKIHTFKGIVKDPMYKSMQGNWHIDANGDDGDSSYGFIAEPESMVVVPDVDSDEKLKLEEAGKHFRQFKTIEEMSDFYKEAKVVLSETMRIDND